MNIILLAIGVLILTVGCFGMSKRIDNLEKNQQFLVNFLNDMQKELTKNDYRNSNVVPFKKEFAEDSDKSKN